MRHVRPKLAWALASALGLLVVAALAGAIEGGPLDPPGPPASTDGVLRPGTPISALPITLNQPGSYYLTHNLASGFERHHDHGRLRDRGSQQPSAGPPRHERHRHLDRGKRERHAYPKRIDQQLAEGDRAGLQR